MARREQLMRVSRISLDLLSPNEIHVTCRASGGVRSRGLRGVKKWGLILRSLGRQGNLHMKALIEGKLNEMGNPWANLLLSEIFPGKLAMTSDVERWVQAALSAAEN
ncbi:hypothetical protein DL765_005382 [Monosporascus sp. GIB2]|nr:hypothetical protein DL765_005382 [Monosporascus sp. GIB2]